MTPFEIAFVQNDCSATNAAIFWLNLFVDAYFWLDLLVNFNTAFYDHERSKWVVAHDRVAMRYIQGWFVLDLVSCLPFEALITREIPSARRAGERPLIRTAIDARGL